MEKLSVSRLNLSVIIGSLAALDEKFGDAAFDDIKSSGGRSSLMRAVRRYTLQGVKYIAGGTLCNVKRKPLRNYLVGENIAKEQEAKP